MAYSNLEQDLKKKVDAYENFRNNVPDKLANQRVKTIELVNKIFDTLEKELEAIFSPVDDTLGENLRINAAKLANINKNMEDLKKFRSIVSLDQ